MTVAVAVERVPALVLDADYRIMEVGPAAEDRFGHLLGRNLWEVAPDARPLFQPYYEVAWRSRQPVEFVQFYKGKLYRVDAVVRERRLELSWSVLHRIDTVTLDGLRTSLGQALALMEQHEESIGRDLPRRRLHALEGGRTQPQMRREARSESPDERG